MLILSWIYCVTSRTPSLSSQFFFFFPPKGTFDLFLHTTVQNIISFVGDFYPGHLSAPWRQTFLCWPQWESSPRNLGSISVSVPPRSDTEPPLVPLSAQFLGWIGSGEAKRISLTALLNWSQCFNFETAHKDELPTSLGAEKHVC